MQSKICSKYYYNIFRQFKFNQSSKNNIQNNNNKRIKIKANKFIFIIIYLLTILKETNLYTIRLKIEGKGKQQILGNNFHYIPDEIYINDIFQSYKDIYVYDLTDDINYITIKYNIDKLIF